MAVTNKPFNIDKRLVFGAYKAVKSNRGAAGCSMEREKGIETPTNRLGIYCLQQYCLRGLSCTT